MAQIQAALPRPHKSPAEYELVVFRLKDVERIVGLKKSKIYSDAAAGKFPKSIALNGTARGWLGHELQEYLRDQVARSRNAG